MPNPRSPSSGDRPVAGPSTGTVAAAGRERVRFIWLGVLVSCAAVAAYLPAMKAGFIWNDDDYVTSPQLRSIHRLEQIWFKVGATEQYYPLLHIVFWLEYRAFGNN